MSIHQTFRTYTPLVRREENGLVYAISPTLDVKIGFGGVSLKDEFLTQEYLHRHDVLVPEPYGIHDVKILNWRTGFGYRNSRQRGIVMEHINGEVIIDRVAYFLDKKLLEAWNETMNTCEKLGVEPRQQQPRGKYASLLSNCIWTPNNKLFFVNLSDCEISFG